MRRQWFWERDLIEQSFAPLLLLMENVESVLHLCEPRSASIDVLPMSYDTLDCGLSSQDGLLFLPEPLNFLLNSSQLLLFCCCIFFLGLFVPSEDSYLVRLCVPMEHLF
jgi:hypothetical protein